MFIFGGVAFGALTYNLYAQGPLLAWDVTLAKILPAIALKGPPITQYAMEGSFYLGKEVVSVLTILHALYFIHKRYWQELLMIVSGASGGGLLFLFLSNLFNRPRPADQLWITIRLPGFPSGHAIVAVAFFGLLAYLLVPKMPSTFWKVFVIVVSLLIIGFIGFGRVFTAGHYLTDILAGYAVGIAWSGLMYTLIELYFAKRRNRNV
jgi:undecaprenyl-diphosphatase